MLTEKSWKMEGVALLIAGILACVSSMILLQAIIQHFVGKESFAEGTLPRIMFGSLTLHGSILAGTALFLWWNNMSWTEAFGFATPGLGRALLLGCLAALIFVPVGDQLQEVSLKLLSYLPQLPHNTQEAVAEFHKSSSWASRAYLGAFAILFAPFAEEVLFRGIFYAGLKQLGHPHVALWGSAFVFATVHVTLGIFLPLFVLGLLLAWLYEKTNNLLSSISAHALFNAINVGLLLWAEHSEHLLNRSPAH